MLSLVRLSQLPTKSEQRRHAAVSLIVSSPPQKLVREASPDVCKQPEKRDGFGYPMASVDDPVNTCESAPQKCGGVPTMRFMQGLSRIADDYERWHHERSSAQSYLPSWQTAAVASTQARIHWSFRRAKEVAPVV